MTLIESARLNGHDPWAYQKECSSVCPRSKKSRPGPTIAASLEACPEMPSFRARVLAFVTESGRKW